jgi:hypothetical protein
MPFALRRARDATRSAAPRGSATESCIPVRAALAAIGGKSAAPVWEEAFPPSRRSLLRLDDTGQSGLRVSTRSLLSTIAETRARVAGTFASRPQRRVDPVPDALAFTQRQRRISRRHRPLLDPGGAISSITPP